MGTGTRLFRPSAGRAVGAWRALDGEHPDGPFLPQVLEHVPLLLYILAAKTLILCLAFAGAKMYQRKRLEAKRQQLEAEKKKQLEKKDN